MQAPPGGTGDVLCRAFLIIHNYPDDHILFYFFSQEKQ